MPGRASQVAKKQTKDRKKPNTDNHQRFGLVFAPSRCSRYMRERRLSKGNSPSSGIFMAGVLEYLSSELLELAGACCLEHKKKQIAPKHIQMAIRNDDELAKLMAHMVISDGGFKSHIESFLMPKKKGKKADHATQEM